MMIRFKLFFWLLFLSIYTLFNPKMAKELVYGWSMVKKMDIDVEIDRLHK